MGTLRDEAYEKLDYLSQLTEVVIGPQNIVLGRVPDRLELSFEQIDKIKAQTWGGPGFELSVSHVLYNLCDLTSEEREYVRDIVQHFQFEVSDDFELDLANQKMTGTITMVKTLQQVDEKQILQMAIDKSVGHLSHYDWPTKRLKDKIATVLNTFEPGKGTEWLKHLSGKVQFSGVNAIKETIEDCILENKWRIRDVNIIAKVGHWINSYLRDETDQDLGLVNLVKLKIMLDKDLPVYSVDEVKNANSV